MKPIRSMPRAGTASLQLSSVGQSNHRAWPESRRERENPPLDEGVAKWYYKNAHTWAISWQPSLENSRAPTEIPKSRPLGWNAPP